MTRLIHHWYAPNVSGLSSGQPVRVRSGCGRTILVSAARITAWRGQGNPTPPPDEAVCPACLTSRTPA